MFAFPINAVSDVARNNAELQLSIFLALSKSMLDTASSLGRLNMQSGIKMLDGLTVAFNDAIQINPVDAMQPFMPKQFKTSMDAMQEHQPGSRNVSFGQGDNLSQALGADVLKRSSSSGNDDEGKTAGLAGSHHEHETDPRPSRLVEKLVASVASDTDILDQ